ncbi:MAG: hypothetical protein KatS3mg124_1026 [Porticoccaceae bacterium]|nr:MAG: hypothetical protein KatS3mg124_1026 [Porticoccaceae bacterium]
MRAFRQWLRRCFGIGGVVGAEAPAAAGRGELVEPRKALYLLAEALLAERMTLTEGCLRICAVAGQLPDAERFRAQYEAFYLVAAATAHLPILDAWRALPPAEQRRLTRERLAVEARHREAVEAAARRLRDALRREVYRLD